MTQELERGEVPGASTREGEEDGKISGGELTVDPENYTRLQEHDIRRSLARRAPGFAWGRNASLPAHLYRSSRESKVRLELFHSVDGAVAEEGTYSAAVGRRTAGRTSHPRGCSPAPTRPDQLTTW
jgi:hypothetical protein